MNNVESQVLMGSLLGDGNIRFPTKQSRNARFKEAHSIKQAEYLRWKAQILSRFGGRIIAAKSRTRGKIFAKVEFYTKSHPAFTKLRGLWYPNGKKIIPSRELWKLGALGLAIWYQDDGCYGYHYRNCSLTINKYRDQAHAILEWFNKKWGLTPSLNHRFILAFSVKDTDKLLHLIANHVHPSMVYKLGHLHSNNQAKIEATRKHQRERNEKRKEYRREYNQRYHWKNRNRILKHQARHRLAMKIYKKNQSIHGLAERRREK